MLIEYLKTMLSYSFMKDALLVGLMVALCSALLGILLVLKRFSMIGDGLSHVGFGALSIAFALNLSPLAVSVPIVIFAAFGLIGISQSKNSKGDAAIAVLSSSALAIGIVSTTLANGSAVDVNSYMFGSILSMSRADVIISVLLSLAVLVLFFLFYNRIFALTFDEAFASAVGVKVKFYNMMLALLIAVTVVIGMRIIGTMLISSLVIFPALSAMRVCGSFKGVTILSAVFSVIGFLVGIFASYVLGLPTGACVVLANLFILTVSIAVGKLRPAK